MTVPGMTIDWSDARYVDPDHLDAFKNHTLPLNHLCGDHDGKVVAVGEQVAWIDEGLAELVWLAWRLDVGTESSCQDVYEDGNPPMALLDFPDPSELAWFLGMVLDPETELCEHWGRVDEPYVEGAWRYEVWPDLLHAGHCILSASVMFPASDIPAMVANLRRMVAVADSMT